ncbi:methylamine utilization protein MauJ [Hydrogenophaga sp.]
MPAIGSLAFTLDEGFDSGIALLLAKAPTETVSGAYGRCYLQAASDSPHVVCRFNGATTEEEAFSRGTVIAQEALDMLSVLGCGDLVTRDAQDEHIVWWRSSDRNNVSLVSTSTFTLKAGPVEITVRDADGNVVPPVGVTPTHHLAFRFYRLAQASDDLFDAYRNMYLAFESLLSSRYPKGRELEINWLRSSLASAASDLELVTLVPATVTDPVQHFLLTVYEGARLPLFHAKDGRAHFAPAEDQSDRVTVEAALFMLTQVVLRMAKKWHSARRRSSWVNLKLIEDQNRTLFDGSRFYFVDDPAVDMKREPDHALLVGGVPFPAVFMDSYAGQPRHNLIGKVDTALLSSRGRLQAIFIGRDNLPLIGFSPDTSIDLVGFHQLNVRLFIRGRNGGQPRNFFPR